MTGWKCPGCSRCWAPDVKGCTECNKAVSAAPAQSYVPFAQPVGPYATPAPVWISPFVTTCGEPTSVTGLMDLLLQPRN